MAEEIRGITWEALEHHHDEKRSDWFWALGIVTVGAAIAMMMFDNTLFAILILLAGFVMGVLAMREPKVIAYAVTMRGIRIDEQLYPYSTLECFFIDEDNPLGPQLLIKSEKLFMPLLIMPIPEEYLDEIDDILSERLPEEELEEPLASKVFEFFGF